MFVILEKLHKLFSMKTHHLRSLKIQAFNNNFNKNATSIFFKVAEKKTPHYKIKNNNKNIWFCSGAVALHQKYKKKET